LRNFKHKITCARRRGTGFKSLFQKQIMSHRRDSSMSRSRKPPAAFARAETPLQV